MTVDWKNVQRKAAPTCPMGSDNDEGAHLPSTVADPWQLITFCGAAGGESVGVVDLLAVRKDHGKPQRGTKRGDALHIILIQVRVALLRYPRSTTASGCAGSPGGIMLAARCWQHGRGSRGKV